MTLDMTMTHDTITLKHYTVIVTW